MALGKILLGGILLASAATDLMWRRIPNQLIGIGLISFFALAGWMLRRGEDALLAGCLYAGALSFFLHLIPWFLQGMGAGDVKLAFVIGLLMGWKDWAGFLGMYCVVLLFASVVFLSMGKRRPKTLPLAPFMTAAYFLHRIFMIYSP